MYMDFFMKTGLEILIEEYLQVGMYLTCLEALSVGQTIDKL